MFKCSCIASDGHSQWRPPRYQRCRKRFYMQHSCCGVPVLQIYVHSMEQFLQWRSCVPVFYLFPGKWWQYFWEYLLVYSLQVLLMSYMVLVAAGIQCPSGPTTTITLFSLTRYIFGCTMKTLNVPRELESQNTCSGANTGQLCTYYKCTE